MPEPSENRRDTVIGPREIAANFYAFVMSDPIARALLDTVMDRLSSDAEDLARAPAVTPEMIEAGVDELKGHWLALSAPELTEYPEIVRAVYAAMRRLALAD